eukprot:2939912-Prymnesium_polylepis.2
MDRRQQQQLLGGQQQPLQLLPQVGDVERVRVAHLERVERVVVGQRDQRHDELGEGRRLARRRVGREEVTDGREQQRRQLRDEVGVVQLERCSQRRVGRALPSALLAAAQLRAQHGERRDGDGALRRLRAADRAGSRREVDDHVAAARQPHLRGRAAVVAVPVAVAGGHAAAQRRHIGAVRVEDEDGVGGAVTRSVAGGRVWRRLVGGVATREVGGEEVVEVVLDVSHIDLVLRAAGAVRGGPERLCEARVQPLHAGLHHHHVVLELVEHVQRRRVRPTRRPPLREQPAQQAHELTRVELELPGAVRGEAEQTDVHLERHAHQLLRREGRQNGDEAERRHRVYSSTCPLVIFGHAMADGRCCRQR